PRTPTSTLFPYTTLFRSRSRSTAPHEYMHIIQMSLVQAAGAEYNFFHSRTFNGNSRILNSGPETRNRSARAFRPAIKTEVKMAVRIGDEAPDFTAETTEGK